jgi:hypothetical protein
MAEQEANTGFSPENEPDGKPRSFLGISFSIFPLNLINFEV